MPQDISGIDHLSSKSDVEIRGDVKESHRGDEALILHGVKSPDSMHRDLINGDVESICNGNRKDLEDLATSIKTHDKGVIERPLKSDLC